MTVNQIAKELLESGKVSVVVGYAEGSIPGKTRTMIARTPEQASKLIFNKYCTNNLITYLTRSYKLPKDKPIGVVVKSCDARTLTSLIQEKQLKREDVYIIGVPCEGVAYSEAGDFAEKCKLCTSHNPKLFDVIAGDAVKENPADPSQAFKDVEEFEKKSPAERWDFWMKEFDKCVRCYACRQSCPLCYCEQCIVDKTQPRWIESSAHPLGNFSWHLIRAFHLAGRCIGCNECERVCHQNIPLSLLNKKMAQVIKEQYGYKAGENPDSKPVLADFKMEDNQDFIR